MFYPASVAFLLRESHIIKMKLAQLQHLADLKGFIRPCVGGGCQEKAPALWLVCFNISMSVLECIRDSGHIFRNTIGFFLSMKALVFLIERGEQ